MDSIITYEEAHELFPFISRSGIDKLNTKIKEKLQEKGLIERCKVHVPRFVKLAKISGEEFSERQYGYKCLVCTIRLHPTEFIEYELNKHSGVYMEPLNLPPPGVTLMCGLSVNLL